MLLSALVMLKQTSGEEGENLHMRWTGKTVYVKCCVQKED